MNDLQKVLFELFLCFDKICKELNVSYFVVAGSALGAVRHNGFIPWDDDFDVAMYRDDYNKFLELAPTLIPEGIFLQYYKTDSAYPYVFARLRNSNTTFIDKRLTKVNINHGIYMDIFPLDGYPQKVSEQRKLAFMKRKFRRRLYCGFDMPRGFKASILATILRMLGYHIKTANTIIKYETYISQYKVKNSNIICNHGNRYGEKDYIPKECYGDGTYILFEGICVRVPEKYDEYLTRLYGDWHTLPPENERKDIHPCEILDTTKSYTEYRK